MNRKSLVSVVIAGVMAASAAVFATVTVNPNGSAFVGKGDVLSLFFTGQKAEANFEANASGISFSETFAQTVEQDCYTNGQHQTFVGIRTGEKDAVLATVVYSARRNSQAKITGFDLEASDPNSIDWSETEWNNQKAPGFDNQGCPNDGSEQDVHPKFSQRFGPLEVSGLWVKYNDEKVQIYP